MPNSTQDEIERLLRLQAEAEYQSISLEKAFLLAKEEWINPPPKVGFYFLPMLEGLIGGFRMGEFTVLCGPTGSGKTSLLGMLSAGFLIGGHRHFVASVETGYADFVRRVFSILANENLNSGEAIPADRLAKYEDSFKIFIRSGALFLSRADNRVDTDLLLAKLENAVKNKCKVALLDNLNFFLNVTRAQDAIVEMDRVTHEIIMFCKNNPIHVVMVMHPKKTDGGRVVSEFDIKGSSTAVQEAHNVLLFNRMDENRPWVQSQKYGKFHREIKVAKLRRNGANVGKTLIVDGTNPMYLECEVL